MKNTFRVLFTIILITGLAACQVPPIQYNTQAPPSIQIPASHQPVKIEVSDERSNKLRGPNDANVEQFPDQRVRYIFQQRLSGNNIQVSDTDAASVLKIKIKEFNAVKDGAYWFSHVSLSVESEANTQNIEAKNKEYNFNMKSAVKALSISVSTVIDDIKWDKLYPGK